MELREAFKLSLTNIRSHKMRTTLAVLSVMIGIAAVIAVVTMTSGFEKALLDVADQGSTKSKHDQRLCRGK